MTPEDLVQRLAPVRLPADFARFGFQDILAIASAGILAGVVLALVFRRILVRNPDRTELASAEIRRLADLDREQRIVGLARLLKRVREEARLPAELSAALYDPAGQIDPKALEQSILDAAKRVSG